MRAFVRHPAAAIACALLAGCASKTQEPALAPSCSGSTVACLRDSYQRRDLDLMQAILHPDFQYVAATDSGPVVLDRDEWLRAHRRLFRPQDAEPPMPPELWLAAIDVSFTQQTEWLDRRDLYFDPQRNPAGLDSTRWRLTGAVHAVHWLLLTQGELDYRLEGRASLVVAEDRGRDVGDAGKFTLYRWEDDGTMLRVLGLVKKPANGLRIGSRPWSLDQGAVFFHEPPRSSFHV